VKFDDRTLMRFHDGELDAEQARRVRVTALADGAVARRLAALSQLGDFVRVFASVRRDELARERLQRQKARTARRGARAVSLALCVVALGALWFRASPLVSHEPGTPVVVRDVAFEFDAPVAPAVRVESVDFGEHDGAIFLVSAPTTTASDTTVVWLGDDPPAAGVGTL
jgi:anti-sigma factor RsiW